MVGLANLVYNFLANMSASLIFPAETAAFFAISLGITALGLRKIISLIFVTLDNGLVVENKDMVWVISNNLPVKHIVGQKKLFGF